MNILDKRFKYVPAAQTDIAATFRRIERERKAKAERDAQNAKEAAAKLRPMKARTA